MKAIRKLVSIVMICCTLLFAGCSGDQKESAGEEETQSKPAMQLNEEVEREAAGKVFAEYYEAYFETFDGVAGIPTGISGNSYFLDHLKEGVSRDEIAALFETIKQNRIKAYEERAQEWAEFTAAGGYIEYALDVYYPIQEDHYYYDKCMNNFLSDEDTSFIDPSGIEAFMQGKIGIDWNVPRTMKSEWGETRHEERDSILVRYKGQWYIAPINNP